jgi:serine/threonine-protein kinase
MSPRVGQVVNNKYRLLRHVGDGGMGSVFEARHETLGTTVALKFLHLEFSKREGLVQRFIQEARASAQIQSPHVVRVSDVDQTAEGDVFIVLEYLEGKTLQAVYEELYRSGRRLSYADALDYATQILDGVEAAHAAGIVHRDLKPDNVMLTVDPKGAPLLKLLDFGIAKLRAIGGAPGLTRPGVLMGTPEYMAPEQTSSAGSVDARADIFSLGVMIFEMLAGQRPVGGEDPHELAAAYRNGTISKLADLVPGIAPELAAAVHRAMAARPEDRFATVAELRAAVEPFAAAVRPPSPSRLRAGGTIGVSIAVTPAPNPAAPLALPPVPPPSPVPMAAPSGAQPGGVAKTWPPEGDVAGAPVAGTVNDGVPSMPVRASGTMVGGGNNAAATQEMAEPYAPAPAPRPVAPQPRRRKKGTPIAGILAGALAVAGLVTGGVYLATRSSSSESDEPPKRKNEPPPPASVGPQQPAPPADTPPPPVAPPPIPTPTPRPATPAPRPSGSTAPSAAPSAGPPPILVIPSAFPFPNPFQPAPQPAPSGSGQKKDPPPQQQPLFPGL